MKVLWPPVRHAGLRGRLKPPEKSKSITPAIAQRWLLVGRGGVMHIESTGLPMGMFRESEFSATRLQLEAGDILFMYTDGLSEARGAGDEYGVDRVARFVHQAA